MAMIKNLSLIDSVQNNMVGRKKPIRQLGIAGLKRRLSDETKTNEELIEENEELIEENEELIAENEEIRMQYKNLQERMEQAEEELVMKEELVKKEREEKELLYQEMEKLRLMFLGYTLLNKMPCE